MCEMKPALHTFLGKNPFKIHILPMIRGKNGWKNVKNVWKQGTEKMVLIDYLRKLQSFLYTDLYFRKKKK